MCRCGATKLDRAGRVAWVQRVQVIAILVVLSFLKTEWGSWDSGRVRKFFLGTFGVMNCWIHNIIYFLCGRYNRGLDGDHNKVDFVSTMLSITWGRVQTF